MMRYVLKLVGLATGHPTIHDGRYVMEYDPTWVDDGRASNFPVLQVRLLTTTGDPVQARHFETRAKALAFYLTVCPNVPKRPWDQKANRPLTAYHCFIEEL